MTDIHCDTNLEATITYRHYVLPILGITQMVTLLPGYIKFIIAHIRKQLKISHFVFIATLIFFTLCFATYTILLVGLLNSCIKEADGISYTLSAVFNASVQLGVVGIMYSRLVQIFQDTDMAVSKCLSRFLWITYVITGLILWSAAVLYTQSPDLSTSIIAVGGLLLIFLVSLVDSLFIYKLCKVYKTHHGHKSSKILQVITKNAILALVSTSLTFISFVAAMMDTMFSTIHSHSWFAITIFFDIYTNFACVLLTFTFFENYYSFVTFMNLYMIKSFPFCLSHLSMSHTVQMCNFVHTQVCGPLHTKCNNEMSKKLPQVQDEQHADVETASVDSASPPQPPSHALQTSGTNTFPASHASQISAQVSVDTATVTDLSDQGQNV